MILANGKLLGYMCLPYLAGTCVYKGGKAKNGYSSREGSNAMDATRERAMSICSCVS